MSHAKCPACVLTNHAACFSLDGLPCACDCPDTPAELNAERVWLRDVLGLDAALNRGGRFRASRCLTETEAAQRYGGVARQEPAEDAGNG